MAATRSRARATRASTEAKLDGAAWAVSKSYRRRTCETCRWGQHHDRGLRFINAALESKRTGGAQFAFPELVREARARFGYPFGDGALRLHYQRACKAGVAK